MNYGTYDLSDIFPFKIYKVKKGDNFKLISQLTNTSIKDIKYLNDFSDKFSD